MTKDRRQARVLSMQALCQWEVQHDESSAALQDFFAQHAPSPHCISYATTLIDAFWQQREMIDKLIASASTQWDFSRISPVERNIMRISVVEMMGDKIPLKVALNEAIDIGAEFGGKESPKFINGVLNHIYQEIQKDIRSVEE